MHAHCSTDVYTFSCVSHEQPEDWQHKETVFFLYLCPVVAETMLIECVILILKQERGASLLTHFSHVHICMCSISIPTR